MKKFTDKLWDLFRNDLIDLALPATAAYFFAVASMKHDLGAPLPVFFGMLIFLQLEKLLVIARVIAREYEKED